MIYDYISYGTGLKSINYIASPIVKKKKQSNTYRNAPNLIIAVLTKTKILKNQFPN